jgi:uncharacterized membrane protein
VEKRRADAVGPHQAPRESRAVNRLINFSDAVVAIAATLLVLPLAEIVPGVDVTNVGALLADNTSKFVAFVLSFVVIYRFWLVHHHIFDRVVDLTPALVWVNCLWLLSIVFLPFPTQLVGSQDSMDRLTYGLYIGTLLVTTASGAVSQWLILRSGRSRAPDEDRRGAPVPALVMTGAMALAFILAVTIPGVGAWALLLLIPAGVAQGRFVRDWGRRGPRQAATRILPHRLPGMQDRTSPVLPHVRAWFGKPAGAWG